MQTTSRGARGPILLLGFTLGLILLGHETTARAEWFVGQRAVIGFASWYGPGFAFRRTASGEVFVPREMTGAHRTLPLGSKVRVTNLRNGRSVLVKINDRGPFRGRREIDLSFGAARELGFVERGIERVLIEPLI